MIRPGSSRDGYDALVSATALLSDTCASVEARLALVDESHPIYRGRGSGEATRLRADIVALLVHAGFADMLVPLALEALESESAAIALASAAVVLQNVSHRPERAATLLERALVRLSGRDEPVEFTRCTEADPRTSATTELQRALDFLATSGRADVSPLSTSQVERCCGASGPRGNPRPARTACRLSDAITNLELQDQNGSLTSLRTLLAGRASLVAFFYTRCMNPMKCSRTISLLGELHRLLPPSTKGSALLAGITYDPEYDTADRLRSYGQDRGLVFNETCQLVRTTGPVMPLVEELQLGVGFGPSTVGLHRIEWLIISPDLDVVRYGSRQHWHTEDMQHCLAAVSRNAQTRVQEPACPVATSQFQDLDQAR